MRQIFAPFIVVLNALMISVFALAAAFSSEAFLGLEPCPLCIYQRWPYAVVIIIAGLGLALRKKAVALYTALGGCALAFLVNSGIALYHSGIERKWWSSAVEGCSVPADFGATQTPQSILENILSAPTGRCDEIPWADPFFGLSMANYNVALCFALFLLCAASLVFALTQKSSDPKSGSVRAQ